MSELYTIKPNGGGDYTTLAAAEAAHRGSMAGRGVVTFECYDGTASAGAVTFINADWPNSDSSNYIRIYAPISERHDGTISSAGACCGEIQIQLIPYTRIEGLRVAISTDTGVIQISDYGLIDSVLVVHSGAGTCIFCGSSGVVDAHYTIQNNIVYGGGIAVAGINVRAGAQVNTTYAFNNTVDGCTTGILMEEWEKKSSGTLNITLENNICTNSTTDYKFQLSGQPSQLGTITANNNASEDTTADDWAGSDNIISQVPGDLFVTEGSDVNLKAGSNAIDAGKTIATFDWDALHLNADNWRPQGSAWDMGALELEQAAPSGWDNKIGGVVPGKIGGVDAGNIGKVGGV
jgi:hypothetical protein